MDKFLTVFIGSVFGIMMYCLGFIDGTDVANDYPVIVLMVTSVFAVGPLLAYLVSLED